MIDLGNNDIAIYYCDEADRWLAKVVKNKERKLYIVNMYSLHSNIVDDVKSFVRLGDALNYIEENCMYDGEYWAMDKEHN